MQATPALYFDDEGPLPCLVAQPLAGPGGAVAANPPLLCFLHGYDEGPPTPAAEGLLRHGPLRPDNRVAELRQLLVVAPQLPARGDGWIGVADAVRLLVERLLQRHDGDPARCYLSGFSFGGNGVFDLALRQPTRWAALWAVDPTRVPPRDPQRPVWLSVGEVARHQLGRYVAALGLHEPHDGPAHGPLDPPRGDRIVLDQQADHVGSARLAFSDPRIYRWLLARRLE